MPWSQDFGSRFTPVAKPASDTNITTASLTEYLLADVERMGLFDFNTGDPIPNAYATLARYNTKHKVTESTTLAPKHVVTLIYVVFNHPENCTAPFGTMSYCSEPDLDNPATDPSILWADGLVLDKTGVAKFSSTIRPGLLGAPGEVVFGNGLQNLESAEVHLATRDKGLPITGMTELQRTTYDGGCNIATCANVQFTIFKPSL